MRCLVWKSGAHKSLRILLVVVLCAQMLTVPSALALEVETKLDTEDDSIETAIKKLHLPKKAHATRKTVNKFVLNDVFREDELSTLGSFDKHPCRRVCKQGESFSCYYRLVVHNYQRLGAECKRCQYDVAACESERCIFGDGVPTPIMAVNHMMPAPAIELCQNDTVVVDVLNQLTEPTTMHWHGLAMVHTPEMDGAPFITQYPVQPSEVFRYSFSADRAGTLWYHSHMGWQRALGVAGSLVIRQTRQENLHANRYDYDLIEHTLMVQDIGYNYDFGRIRNILINGKGRNHITTLPDNDPRHRYERLRVTPGYRYRMRVISNGVFNCPIEFSIESHRILMISTDGNDIVPIEADSFFIGSAERFDFILTANQYASNYWIRVRGYGNCSSENLYQGAVLHYRGASRNANPGNKTAVGQSSAESSGRQFIEEPLAVAVSQLREFTNAVNGTKDNGKEDASVATSALRSLQPLPWPRYTKFLTYYSSFGSRTLPNGQTLFQIDDITFRPPTMSLLQSRHLFNENLYFCNRSAVAASGRNCVREHCACTNVLRLPAYRPIELVVANYDDSSHPFHMHGYTYRLVGQGVIGSMSDLRRIQELDSAGVLLRTPPDFPAVQKDTIQIPGLGYVIVRFLSNNPGYWTLHCHLESHAQQGMTAVLKIGENFQIKGIPPKLRCS